jgi:hypothetical protein
MNLGFFQALLQEKTSFSNQSRTHILGIGSIANLAAYTLLKMRGTDNPSPDDVK